MNLYEIGLFHVVWGVSKGTCDNYHDLVKIMFYVQNMSIYIWILGGTRGTYMVHHTFFVYYFKKIEKVQDHDLCLNQILHHFDFKKIFIGLIIKKIKKEGPRARPPTVQAWVYYAVRLINSFIFFSN